MVCITCLARAMSAKALTLWAGRPFFMWMGVSQASCAPDSKRASMACASVSPVASSMLVSSSITGWPGSGGEVVCPSTTWVRFGRSSSSRVPAPKPLAWIFIAGSGPKSVARVAMRAAPVGVVISAAISKPKVGTPWSISVTAGGGLGMSPCALRIIPIPCATGLESTSPTPSTSSALLVPTISTMASRLPTS